MGLRSLRIWRFAAGVGVAVITIAATAGSAAAASYVPINGSGSSWASVAIDQWSQDLASSGVTVNFNPDGSAAGRADYATGQDDFAASDSAYRSGRDKLAGLGPERVPFGYSYVPDVAGGIAFVYHLTIAGHRITNLRLSGATLMKIFTGQITNWDNPQISRDFGRRLPSIPITPVVHSEGSGDTFFFTRWIAHVFPREWNSFCARVTHGRVKPPCGPTEYYPARGWGNVQAENGAANVVAYVTAPYANGAIGYDPYAYALAAHAPVLRLRNPAGRYVLPAAANVTAALTRAVINEDPHSKNFLQENLDLVYASRNPRSYPLSYYSYLIVPRAGTTRPPNFTTAKGRTLSTFVAFALCAGQRQAAELGYAPLPRNLVSGGLQQVGHIPGHVRVPTLAECTRGR